MALQSRWVRAPAELRRLFAGHERLLALGDSPDSVVVATNLGLWLPEGSTWRRVGWDRVVKAAWTSDGLELIEGSLDEGMVSDLPLVSVALAEPRNLPAVVRVRVEASIARSEQVHVPGGTGRLVARRVPGMDGVTWTARLDTGTPETLEARATMAGYLHRVASTDQHD